MTIAVDRVHPCTAERTRRMGWLCGVVLALAGCGGSGDDTAPPAPGSPRFTLNATTMADAGAFAMGGETLLQLGQLAIDLTSRFDAAGSAEPIDEACPGGGSLAMTLLDRDGDGKPSAGDRVAARLQDCGVALLARIGSGKVEFEIGAATGTPLAELKGTLSFGNGFVMASVGAPAPGTSRATSRIHGSLAVDASRATLLSALAVTSTAADDFRIVREDLSGSPSDAYHRIEASKRIEYDQARSRVAMSFSVDSGTLGAGVIVATPEPLVAWLDTYPDQGLLEVRVAGEASVLRMRPSTVSAAEDVDLALDLGGNGTDDHHAALAWATATAGYLWWDGYAPVPLGDHPYATLSLAAYPMRYSVEVPDVPGPSAPVRVQFSRIPVSLLAASPFDLPRWRFRDYGSTTTPDPVLVDVPAVATREGAVLLIRPEKQLRHARVYLLEMAFDGTGWSNGGVPLVVRDGEGNTTSWAGWLTVVRTADTMLPIATAEAALLVDSADRTTLDAQASRSTRPIAAVRWTQLSGTPLVFDNPDAVTTVVRLASAHPLVLDDTVVELRITDVHGETETCLLNVAFLRTQVTGKVLYFRSTPGDPAGLGRVGLEADSTSFRFSILPESSITGIFSIEAGGQFSNQRWRLALSGGDRVPIHVGTYENTLDGLNYGSANTLSFRGLGDPCPAPIGGFEVLEIERDPSGVPVKLALDFEQRCNNGTSPPLFGSVRIDSSIPLRP